MRIPSYHSALDVYRASSRATSDNPGSNADEIIDLPILEDTTLYIRVLCKSGSGFYNIHVELNAASPAILTTTTKPGITATTSEIEVTVSQTTPEVIIQSVTITEKETVTKDDSSNEEPSFVPSFTIFPVLLGLIIVSLIFRRVSK